MSRMSLSTLPPLFFGRLTRVLFGLGSLWWAAQLWSEDPGSWVWAGVLALLGVSFLVGGLMANPGCEVTALPNLFLPPEKRLHSL